MAVTSTTATSSTEALRATQDASLPATIRLSDFLMTQSGQVFMTDPFSKAPLVPGLEKGLFERMEVNATTFKGNVHSYELDENGRPKGLGTGPWVGGLESPLEVTLVAKDGTRYTGTVDLTYKKQKVSTQAAFDVKGLELTRVDPPPPSEFKVPSILLSQSGQAHMPDPYGKEPLVPGAPPGYFQRLEVTGLDGSNVHPTHSYDLDAKGRLGGLGTGPWVGGSSYPMRLTLVAKDGERYSATVDISYGKIGWSGQASLTLKDLEFRRVTEQSIRTDAPLDEATRARTQRGPDDPGKRSTVERSPQFFMVSRSRE